jgi:predicted AlkP superfamily pyrophosphatase or phosphodiesterase
MNGKVLLILVDGMRPDAVTSCTHPAVRDFMENSLYTLSARTVMPSVTLPTHMSLVPQRSAGTARDNHKYISRRMVQAARRICASASMPPPANAALSFTTGSSFATCARPGSLSASPPFSAAICMGYEAANELVTCAAIECLESSEPDFMFVYLGWVDEAGHAHGWMGDEYMRSVRASWDQIERMSEVAFERGYTVIVTADHGGHERSHGSDMDEDMLIPLFIRGEGIEPGTLPEGTSILDIAPTAVSIVGAQPAREWEGKVLL